MMLSLFTRTKSFRDPWVGHRQLNTRLHLHRRRIQLAEHLCQWRQRLRPAASEGLPKGVLDQLERDGCCAIEEFLPNGDFARLSEDVERLVTCKTREQPWSTNQNEGFQPKQPFRGGFDRFDGGTLNRFLHIDPCTMPRLAELSRDPRLQELSRQVVGVRMDPRKLDVYLTVHGEENCTPDLQKVLHRDTYFRALKFWYFLRPVEEQDGPFEYVLGSHRLSRLRLRWEQQTATAAITHQQEPDVSGSFRIQEQHLAALDLPRPVRFTCPANTLILADVFGFHRRGDAQPGRERLAIYGWNRPYPFLPLTW